MKAFDVLPNEVITEIFQFCLPEGKYQSPNPRHVPLLLMHVCSSWRSFTLSTPSLWQSIGFETTGATPSKLPEATALAEVFKQQMALWSQNSRGQPLDLKLSLVYTPYVLLEEGGVPIFDTSFWSPFMASSIAKHAERIRKLYLATQSLNEDSPSPLLPEGSVMPLLESIHLQCKAMLPMTAQPFSQAPNLRKAIVDLRLLGSITIPINLPWKQLTHVVFVQAHPDELFFFVLSHCPLLEELTMTINENSSHRSSPLITMPYLRSLSLTMSVDTTPTIFIGVFLPSLQNFTLKCDTYRLPQSIKWLPITSAHDHLYNQFFTRLRTLKLGFHKIPAEVLLEMLRHCPQVDELALDVDVGSYPAFLNGLTYHEEFGPQILPNLQIFHFYVEINIEGLNPTSVSDPTIPFTSAEFLSMIRSRGRSVNADTSEHRGSLRPLKQVHLFVERVPYMHALDLDSLKLEVKRLPELRDIEFRFPILEDKLIWMAEEIGTW